MHEPESFQTDDTRLVDNRSDPLNISNSTTNIIPESSPDPSHRLIIKLPPMPPNGPGPILGLRRSTRRTTSLGTNSLPSGSEYQQSEKSMDIDPDADAEGEEEVPSPEPKVEYAVTTRGRRITKKSYIESESDGDPIALKDMFADDNKPIRYRGNDGDDEDDEDDIGPRRPTRRSARSSQMNDFIVSDDDHPLGGARYPTRSRTKKPPSKAKPSTSNGRSTRSDAQRAARQARRARRSAKAEQEEDGYVDEEQSPSSPDGEFDDAPHTSEDLEDAEADADGEGDGGEAEQDGKPYALRQRAKINYAIPPPLEEMRPIAKGGGGRGGRSGGGGGGRNGGARLGARRGPGWSASGAELGRWMGMPGDDSDSDYNTRTPRKQFGGVFGGGGAVAGGAGGTMLPGDLAAAAAGTPSNLGKIGDASLADADPLGVNTNVTFNEVGGLDDHIHSLKEMTLLPLLYPEVFQRFNVTPPRGVLFHGPPGTGKTLLARALAASCRKDGKQISFFMRKGADCLSKWVGEAERQLRLLFEEARNSQPSIIFFDEIDGLAPVRSSKQDQIHASIVSTLLALMDGMDGRGQVVVIGATNRPDAVDPALRRPGRFDREFYFGLPSLEAREKILGIMTKGWDGWDAEKGEGNVKGLAKLTKGYGGADLRALCTEAALNAVQRRYPQIYKSNERLLLKPESIEVGLRDFMISIKKLVPSSARSTSSSAAPLPPQFTSLLSDTLDKVKEVIGKVLPVTKKLTALEEAEWEEESEEGALEREMMNQSMETLRIYRPRMILHGPVGMGQSYVGPAALHHLEGYHVQSLELGSLMSDSTRTVEAAIVQLFVEAKRHQPSVIYIPSLIGWCATVSEISRSTVRAMLDTLAPTDPILLLAIVDGPFSSLPRDVRAWFGPSRDNRVAFASPTSSQREEFFDGLIKDVQRPPNEFADGMKRKKRILEVLPIAPPLEPRQPTAAELALQEENDQRIITLLKYRLGPILTELKRKFKRFTKRAREEYDFEAFENAYSQVETVTTTTIEVQNGPNGIIEIVDEERTTELGANGAINGIHPEQQPQPQQQQQQQMMVEPQQPALFDMDLERMHIDLYKGKYLTPQDFLDDVGKIVHNAGIRMDEDPDRLYKAQAMLTAAQVSIHEFDPGLRIECDRMASRERQRRKEHKKSKDKGKSRVDDAAHVVGTRRSARHNGQQPELSITDPLKLERKLKRQRSNEDGGNSRSSSEENGDGRDTKRSKLSVTSDDDDRDPLDIVGPTSSQPRLTTVRFASDVSPINTPREGATPMDVFEQHEPELPPSPSPRKTAGFDPFLLNPSSPPGFTFPNAPHLPSLMNGMIFPASSNAPVLVHHSFQQPDNQAFVHAPVPQVSPPHTPIRIEEALPPVASAEEEPQPQLMMIERTPTPLPEFHVDQSLVFSLKGDLRDTTSSLNVEQLEQLRATCLGSIWRHRKERDRDALVRGLKEVVKEFVDEVAEDMSDSAPMDQGRW